MKRLFNIGLFFALLASVGCERLPLYDESGRIRLMLDVDLDIRHQPATPAPETMLVLFYDPVTHQYIARDYTGPTGGEIYIDAGRYDILTYNFDTERTVIRNLEHFEAIEAYTNEVPASVRNLFTNLLNRLDSQGAANPSAATPAVEAPSEGRAYGDDPIIYEPDHLFVGRIPGATIPVRVEGEEVLTLQATAATILETYRIEVGPITGDEYIQSAEIFLTGQRRSRFIGSDQPSDEAATIHFPVSVDRNQRAFVTTFNTFGKYPGAENRVYLNILITDTGGGQYQYQYDVTDQFDDPQNDEQQIIINDPIDIPEPSKGGGGFLPEVDEWNDNQYDIEL